MSPKSSKRVFIALELPEEIKEKLSALKEHFRGLPAKWVEKENIHLTLFFWGKLEEEKIQKVIEVLSQVKDLNGIKIKGETLELGPPGKKKRLLWVKVKKETELINLHDSLSKGLRKIGLKVEEREFLPHITLARLRSFWEREFPKENLPVFEDIFEPFEVIPKSITLFESRLTPQGPVYYEIFRVGI